VTIFFSLFVSKVALFRVFKQAEALTRRKYRLLRHMLSRIVGCSCIYWVYKLLYLSMYHSVEECVHTFFSGRK